ncbi:MAG: PVC-type heme-binding CxxCH protein, partial [Pirellulales bacterium]
PAVTDTTAFRRFVDGLAWPTAVICYGGGVFIGDAPDIFYCKDTDGDGRCDQRQMVLTGFGTSNVQGLLNTFLWGLDNRIHGTSSSSGGQIRPADRGDAEAVNVNGRDFAFDPRSGRLEATSGGGQHGMTFDDWGRKFVCSNSDHVQQVMFDDRYLARNPYLSAPSARLSIAADGPQAEVYRISPVEPWRIVRTRLRVAGAVPGPVEGGGRASGYFTSATGLTIYRGDAWPPEHWGLAIVGDVGSNLVHRKRLEANGLALVARRIDEASEFVASRDIWFRPAQFAVGPDGALYIADVYREVIEHPDSLAPIIKRHLDLTSGRDRGRIYRVVPDGFQQRPLPRLSQATTAELAALLQHANGWHRDTASRLLYERQDKQAVGPLEQLASESSNPLGRLHALYALRGLDALSDETLLAALADSHPGVREHAVRLAEQAANGSSAIRERLYAMAADGDLRVRYQLAFTLGEITDPSRLGPLAELARSEAADRWLRLAVLSSLADGGGKVFVQLAADEAFGHSPAGREMLAALALQAGRAQRPDDIAAVLEAADRFSAGDAWLAETIVRGLAEGLARSGGKLDELAGGEAAERAAKVITRLLAHARAIAQDGERPLEARSAAIQTLTLGPFDQASGLLARLLDHRQPHEIQSAALASLAHYNDAGVGPLVLEAWPALSPRLRVQATEALFARAERLDALLTAIDEGRVNASDIETARLRLLASHADAGIRERGRKLVEQASAGRRQDVVEAYRDVLDLPGDAERGREAFKKVCAACHKAEGAGHEIGPNLATIQNRGPEAVLVNMLDPSREVNPQYVNYVLITLDGLTMTGMIASETATSVTLQRAEGAGDTVLRLDIDELQSTGLSIMPEGVEKELDRQAMADLIAYLLSLK